MLNVKIIFVFNFQFSIHLKDGKRKTIHDL